MTVDDDTGGCFAWERLFDLSMDMLAVASLDRGMWMRVNPAFTRILGWSTDELLGMPFLDLVHAEDLDRSTAAAAQLSRGEPLPHFENRIRCKDGGYRWISWQTVSEVHGGEKLMYCVGRDVTGRMAAEEAARDGERRLRTLADAVPQLVWSATADGTVDFYSHRCHEYTGLSQNRDGSWNWAPVLHPDDQEATVAAWAKAIESGQRYDIEHRVERKDGGFRWHVSRAVPVHDAEGRVVRWYGSATDIHDLKTAERALHESEARLRATFEGVADGLISLAADGRVMDLNPAFAHLHGYPDMAAARLSLDRFVDEFETRIPEGEEIAVGDLPFSRALRGETVRDVEMEARRRADGQLLFIGNYNAVPVRNEEGAIAQVVVTIRDVTERRRTEERQRLLAREVDHRARNALAVVQAVMSLTRADTVEDFAAAVRGRVETIARCHTRLTESRWLNVPLRNLLNDELRPYEADGWDRVCCEGPDVSVAAAAVQPLSMILHELVTNAVKYGALSTPRGGIRIVWDLTPDGSLHLRWRESGGPAVSKPTRRGVGSTVMIGSARQLAATLEFQWEPGGLASDLALPPGVAAPERAAKGSEAALAAAAEARAGASDSAAGRRILVVEDEALLAAELVQLLEAMGHDAVGPATTVEEALRLAAAETHLDAAVLDVNLGGRPSWLIADVLKARGIPFVFATGYGDADGAGPQIRGVRLVQKPFSPSRLTQVLGELLNRRAAE